MTMNRSIEKQTDILDQIDDDALLEEAEYRGFLRIRTDTKHTLVDNCTGDEFRRILCDMLSLGYQVSDDEILGRIKECL